MPKVEIESFLDRLGVELWPNYCFETQNCFFASAEGNLLQWGASDHTLRKSTEGGDPHTAIKHNEGGHPTTEKHT